MKLLCRLLTAFILLSFSSLSLAITTINKQVFEDETTKVKVHQDRIRRSAEFMKEIRDNVLYTEKNRYSLNNVTIVDLAKGKKEKKAVGRKRLVELVFVNDILREIVIHP
jgi:hypothetical protein